MMIRSMHTVPGRRYNFHGLLLLRTIYPGRYVVVWGPHAGRFRNLTPWQGLTDEY